MLVGPTEFDLSYLLTIRVPQSKGTDRGSVSLKFVGQAGRLAAQVGVDVAVLKYNFYSTKLQIFFFFLAFQLIG